MNLPDSLLKRIAWDSPCNPIWPASSFFLHRNIANYPFPGKLTSSQSLQILEMLKKSLLQISNLKEPLCLPASLLSPQEKEFLCEHFLSQEGWANTSQEQAFIIDGSSHFLTVLNHEDHLVLQWVDCKGEWEKAWESLSNIELSIGNHLPFAFSSQFGYLTSNPKLCGTSLQIECYLHLPALIAAGQLSELLDSNPIENIQACGLFGKPLDLIGDFLVLKNKYTLGITEECILNDLQTAANKLVFAEKNERLQYKNTLPIKIKDQMSRAYGLLIHSYQLETKEALNAISQIKLGIDLGFIKGMTDEEINELFFRCRRAHLLQSHEKISLDAEEIAHARAKYLYQQLKKTTLQF